VQRDLIGTAGIILTPKYTKVECSWDTDMGSMNSGCGRKSGLTGTTEKNPFPPERLEDMLKISMQPDSAQHQAGKSLGVPVYNEVVVNSTWFIDHLPGSIAAIVYFDDADSMPKTNAGGVVAKDNRAADKVAATAAYVSLLDAYNLTETDIPMLVISREGDAGAARGHVTDVSFEARRFLEKHSEERYREDSPRPGSDPVPGHRPYAEFPREKFDREVDSITKARRAEEVVARPGRSPGGV